jgi:hypothetical protein
MTEWKRIRLGMRSIKAHLLEQLETAFRLALVQAHWQGWDTTHLTLKVQSDLLKWCTVRMHGQQVLRFMLKRNSSSVKRRWLDPTRLL